MNFFHLLFLLVADIFVQLPVLVFGIIGGEPVTTKYPFFVQIKTEHYSCGGTIVGSDAIITAAHCLFLPKQKRWARSTEIDIIKADFTQLNWEDQATRLSCELFVTHNAYDPTFNGGFNPWDIAVIKLFRHIDLTDPENAILKPCHDLFEFAEAYFVGMGVTSKNPDIAPPSLMGAKLFKNKACKKSYRKIVWFKYPSQLCYGSKDPNTYVGACEGDSGGPLVYRDFFHNPICLIGISGYRPRGCDNPKYPSVFTNAGYWKEWIDDLRTSLSKSSLV